MSEEQVKQNETTEAVENTESENKSETKTFTQDQLNNYY
jgi:hypothetical protein